ncbi:SMI1/KNR4 family protein [Leptolyngbya sp. FACHB-321]|uniref:SMI1/KNR4 family protein n=1 Tax=Leptolyngbya sp. FACHB-321 TaxID=2692807 RepID=UPI001685043E|nr:SMI1/KNR4 family protein [Leptolyngbya sp. FACHB-321]MBD2034840.1 SMI1/KNR4 family protein [Leptolyngbya sp. FACHB-321]
MSALTDALNRIIEWLQQNSPTCASGFLPGLSSREIEEKLSELPFCVSREVYELYQWRNGINNGCGVFVYHCLLNLETALRDSQGINDSFWLEAREEDGNPKYLFLIFDFDGEYFAVPGSDSLNDTAPIFHVDGDDGSLSFAFTNLTHMMLAIAECYETGVYSVTSDGNVEVTDEAKFGEIRRKHNPGSVEQLYANGW